MTPRPPTPNASTQLDARVWQAWGKADPAEPTIGPTWHPLLCHLLDVAACARIVVTAVFPARLSAFASAFGIADEDALAWTLLVVALHDLGKLTPAFQGKVAERREALRALGLDFPESREPHGSLATVLARPHLERLGCPTRLARGLAAAVAAHHGDFATTIKVQELSDDPGRAVGRNSLWEALRRSLVDTLADIFGVTQAAAPSLPREPVARHALYADLAGLVTVADWVGSDEAMFAYAEPPADARTYFEHALHVARGALGETGFRPPPRPRPRSFVEIFARSPWPLHDAMARLEPHVTPGSLVIVEAPMGEGKTEAALLLDDALAARGAAGLYFALPTQATANQLLGRVARYLAAAFPGERHELHLVHGGAGLSSRYDELKRRAFRARSVGDVARAEGDEGPVADAWFARPKRALLAPIAVGTVDQALLGVLRSRHHFLRLHGLAHKVVVVDEVHAYDTFTSDVLTRLCEWLRAMGSTVVLLSATLASPQRTKLLTAYGAAEPDAAPAYPRLTLVQGGRVRSESFAPRRPGADVVVEWKDEAGLPSAVADAASGGGCIGWIVNTVARAQATYLALRRMRDSGELAADVELSLLHARLPFAAREERERAAERAFGPDGTHRPRAAIVVGTQVLEQSLDLDFDLMVTDLAPVDLVLQRAGRLHRHDRGPRAHGRCLWIARPDGVERHEGPTFGVGARIYEEAILLRSFHALATHDRFSLPSDIEPLVESVYAPRDDAALAAPVRERLARLDRERDERRRADEQNANRRALQAPCEHNPFGDFSARYDEDDPRVHADLRAITRLGDPSVAVVPVVRRGDRFALAADSSSALDLSQRELPAADVRALARQALSVSHRAVVRELLRQNPPGCFQRSGHLRHHRLLVLDETGGATIGETAVRLDPELGLVIGGLDTELDPT